jgi:hypothetical protein
VGFYSIAAGYNTTASQIGTAAFGYQASASGAYSFAMGHTANASGQGSLALGYRSTADSDYGVAIGQRATTNGFTGAIVISDASSTDSLQASVNNQFSLRAAGGTRIYTNSTKTLGVSLAANGTSWAVISDRAVKENFRWLEGEDVLARIRRMPVQSWNYIDEGRQVRHIGPMAQDWHAAWGLNADDRTINSADFDGVNLAAIQALETRTAGAPGAVGAHDRAAGRERGAAGEAGAPGGAGGGPQTVDRGPRVERSHAFPPGCGTGEPRALPSHLAFPHLLAAVQALDTRTRGQSRAA